MKRNEIIIALSRNIKAEINFKTERAFISNINKVREGVNILRKRLKKISSYSLSKEAGNSIILKGRKQKKSLVLSLKT